MHFLPFSRCNEETQTTHQEDYSEVLSETGGGCAEERCGKIQSGAPAIRDRCANWVLSSQRIMLLLLRVTT